MPYVKELLKLNDILSEVRVQKVVRSAAVMGRARDSWRGKPLALVSREIIG